MKKKYKVAINEAKLERQRSADSLKQLRMELGIYDWNNDFPVLEDQMDMAEIFGDELLKK